MGICLTNFPFSKFITNTLEPTPALFENPPPNTATYKSSSILVSPAPLFGRRNILGFDHVSPKNL